MNKLFLTTTSIMLGAFLACVTADKTISLNAVRGYSWLIAGVMKSISTK